MPDGAAVFRWNFARTATTLLVAWLLVSLTLPMSTVSVSTSQTLHVEAGAVGGDGSALSPFGSIQDAVDAASAGDTVLVGAGTYEESVAVDVPRLTIEAAPDGVVEVVGGPPVFDVTGDGVTLEDLVISAVGSTASPETVVAITADDVTLRANEVRGTFDGNPPGAGVLIVDAVGVDLIDNRIRDTVGPGVLLDGTSESLIAGNEVQNTNGTGIAVLGATNDVLRANQVTFLRGHGILLDDGASANLVVDNTVRVSDGDHIRASASTVGNDFIANNLAVKVDLFPLCCPPGTSTTYPDEVDARDLTGNPLPTALMNRWRSNNCLVSDPAILCVA